MQTFPFLFIIFFQILFCSTVQQIKRDVMIQRLERKKFFF